MAPANTPRAIIDAVAQEIGRAVKNPRLVERLKGFGVDPLGNSPDEFAAMIKSDPMFASMFLANLGSIHMDSAYHHLYEYGTCSFFGVMGAARHAVVASRAGATGVREILQAYWSFDERVNDGFYCVESLALLKRIMEDPRRHVTRTPAAV